MNADAASPTSKSKVAEPVWEPKTPAKLAPGETYDVTFNDKSLGLAIGHAADDIHFVVQKIAPGQKDSRLEVNDILFAINGEHLHEDEDVNHHSALPMKLGTLPRPLTVTFKKPSDEPVAPKDPSTPMRKLASSSIHVTDEGSVLGTPVAEKSAAIAEPPAEEEFPEPEDEEVYEAVKKPEESKLLQEAKPVTSSINDFLHQPHVAIFVAFLALAAMAYLVLHAEMDGFKEAEQAVIEELKQATNPSGFLKKKIGRN